MFLNLKYCFLHFKWFSQKDIANMKNELEKRQREEDSAVKANQITQQSEESTENGCDNSAALSNGINPTLVTC